MNGCSRTRYLSKKEVAEIMKVSVRTISRYMYYGLPYKKIRGTVRILENELHEWIRNEGEPMNNACSPITAERL